MKYSVFPNKKTILCFLVLGSIVFAGCKRKQKQCTYVCDNTTYFGIQCTGFNYLELDTMIIKKYWPGDTIKPISITTAYNVAGTGLGRFSPLRDWEFYIPATKKRYRFTQISREGRSEMKVPCETIHSCVDEFFSHKLNGQVVYSDHGEIVK